MPDDNLWNILCRGLFIGGARGWVGVARSGNQKISKLKSHWLHDLGWLLFQFYLYYQILNLLGVVPMVGVVGVEK